MRKKGDNLEIDGTLKVRYDDGRYFISFNSPEDGPLTLGYFVSAPQVIEEAFEN